MTKKGDGFILFKSIFLTNRSFNIGRKGNLYLTKIDLIETKFTLRKIIIVT